ncbi:MAG: zinc ABC transporter ATP-binding protein ZnuC [Gammaproteobacteria bacterium]|nr:zinc ABC transporter ATP-binding protein ZnuC [Gammaproteobacteria bacterium]
MVACSGLGLTRAGTTLLDSVDLVVHAGEIVTLIGPNGAGKTTLVRLLLGLDAPDRGRVERRPGLRVGYLPQRLAVDPVLPLDVGRLLTLTRSAPETDRRRVLREVGVPHLLHSPVQRLSGGEMQRVLLARALLGDPDLLVLDEPTQGIDFNGQVELYRLVEGLRDRRGCGVLMVSHDLHLVMAATDRVLCLNRHVCCHGEPESVRAHPEYQALFGPRIAADLAVYAHHHDHAHALSGEVAEEHREETGA